MSGFLLAEFATEQRAREAVRTAWEKGCPAQDALLPSATADVYEFLAPRPRRAIGWVMFMAGTVGAALGYLIQWYSAGFDYPINSGGRPLNSWPAFLLVPYESAILCAGVIGLLAWMWMCGLPKLFHPLFAFHASERAVQDRYVLVFPADEARVAWIDEHLRPDALYEAGE